MRPPVNFLVVLGATYVTACDPSRQYSRRPASVSNVPTPSPAIGSLSVAFTTTLAALPAPPTPISGFFNATLFPLQQQQNVTDFLRQAAELSTDWRIHQFFQDQCITQQVFPSLFTQPAGFVTPFSPFDNFYFVGHAFVSAWAYDTGDGLVVIDALDSSDEIEAIMIPALEKFGFSGNDVKHVIITHEHLDHYGGAKNGNVCVPSSLNIYSSKQGRNAGRWSNSESRKCIYRDHPYTWAHPRTLSLIFPLTAKNGTEQHMAGLNGGTGIPQSAIDRTTKVLSHNRLASIAYLRGVDTLISNHQIADHALFNSDLLAHSSAGTPNPFVIGKDNYYNYLSILGLCTKVYAAR